MWSTVKALGLKIIAITAHQVAGWTHRFGHDDERFANGCRLLQDFVHDIAPLPCAFYLAIILLFARPYFSR